MSLVVNNIFGTLCNGDIEIQLLTEEYIEGAIEVLRTTFFINENVCRATDVCLPQFEKARKELEDFGRGMINDGISLVAKHVPTNKIVAVAINTLLYLPKPGEITYAVNFAKNYVTTPNMETIMEFLAQVDNEFNIFKNFEIDCIFEIMFLSTLREFEKQKIGRTLCEYSIKFARDLNQGIGIEYVRDNLRSKKPEAISALFTSQFSQRIGDSLGFKVWKKISYDMFSYQGKTFAEKIGPFHPYCTISGILF